MLLRPIRLMVLSPKRIPVVSYQRVFHSSELSLSSSDDSNDDAFVEDKAGWFRGNGSDRPKKVTPSALSTTTPPASRVIPRQKPGKTLANFSSKNSTSRSSLFACSTAVSQTVSTHSKGTGTTLDPPIVHPLLTYSYKTYNPPPSRVYVRSEEEANKLVETLSGPVGFDIEWKVIFYKGAKMRPAATVQLSDRRTILVIQVSSMKVFPKKLKEILENPDIAKVGVNIQNDGKKLARDHSIRAQGLVELGGLARQADAHYIERYFRASEANQKSACPNAESAPKLRKPGARINLAAITTMYTGRTLPKGEVRTSDWEVQPLSEEQLEYAANDAHSALIVYQHLLAIAKAANMVLKPAEYTSGVQQDYACSSGARETTEPRKFVPIFQAPTLVATTPPPSTTSTSTSTSKDRASFISTSTSTSSYSSVSVSPTVYTSATVKLSKYSTSLATSKPIFPASHVNVSDTDIENFRIGEQVARGRPGPRFKPSYNNFPRPASEPTGASPTSEVGAKDTRVGASGNPSPERKARFKPSYNTLSRPSSPTKQSMGSDNAVPVPSSSSSTSTTPIPSAPQPIFQQPQHIRAYNLWHIRQFTLPEICVVLRSRDNPLKQSTVITYVVRALQADPRLHFSRERLRKLLASEPKSWMYYKDWFHALNTQKYVNMDVN